jgi:hypothetical protein
MPPRGPGRIVTGGLLALALLCAASRGLDEEVDFARRPAAGLRFRVTDKQEIRCAGKVTRENDPEAMDLTQQISSEASFAQTVVEVKDGEIIALEREYEEVSRKITARTSRVDEPQEIEQSDGVAWKHYRARWKDGELVLEVRDEDTWRAPGEQAKRRLSPTRLRDPLVPLPRGRKKVGESWELEGPVLRDYFSDLGETGTATGRELDGSARFTLTGFEDLTGDRCAVIAFELKLEVEAELERYAFTLTGQIHYSLRHRIVVRMKGDGPLRIASDREQLGRAMQIRLTGTRTMDRTVKILSAGGKEGDG